MATMSDDDGDERDVAGAGEPTNPPNPISRSSGGRTPASGPGRESSRQEGQGVSGTDTEATSALGVGRSTARSGEKVVRDEGKEAGRREVGSTGKAERSAGRSSGRDSTGVNPHKKSEGGKP